MGTKRALARVALMFDIKARAPGVPSREQLRLMVRSLLEDRFQRFVEPSNTSAPYGLQVAVANRPEEISSRFGPTILELGREGNQFVAK
jgi:hypothetical protein